MGGIFICYRREDSVAYAGRLFDHLSDQFAGEQIFMDIDTMKVGFDFVSQLEIAVAGCDVLIVVIGKNWLTATNDEGKRLLDDPEDFVRIEIKTALERNIPVVPLLVGGAVVPKGSDLPNEIAHLSRRHGVEISDIRFRTDVSRFVESIKEYVPERFTEASSDLALIDRTLIKPEKRNSPGKLWIKITSPKSVVWGILLFLLIGIASATSFISKEQMQEWWLDVTEKRLKVVVLPIKEVRQEGDIESKQNSEVQRRFLYGLSFIKRDFIQDIDIKYSSLSSSDSHTFYQAFEDLDALELHAFLENNLLIPNIDDTDLIFFAKYRLVKGDNMFWIDVGMYSTSDKTIERSTKKVEVGNMERLGTNLAGLLRDYIAERLES